MESRPRQPKNSQLSALEAWWLQFHFKSWMKYSGWKQIKAGGIWLL